MDIKIEETEDTLKIIKSCKEELKWAFIIGIICNACILYPILKITPGEFYFGFLLFYTPIFLMIQANVLNILYIKISKIANFSATFSMLVLFISRLKSRVF